MKLLCLTITAVLLVPLWAGADDLMPADFRGDPLSVYAEWFFPEPPDFTRAILPQSFSAVPGSDGEALYGGYATAAYVDNPSQWAWESGAILSPSGDYVSFDLQNWVDDEDWKLIRIQITYTESFVIPPPPPPQPDIVAPQADYGGPLGVWHRALGGGRAHATYDWYLEPNVDYEAVLLASFGGAYGFEHIIVDTVSAPEPATFSLLALGGLCILLRRRFG